SGGAPSPDDARERGGSAQLLAREVAEAGASIVVRPERFVFGVAWIGGELLRYRAQLPNDGGLVAVLAEERLDPRLGAVVGRHVAVDEEPAEDDADADVGERPEGERAACAGDELVDVRVLGLELLDDRPDRLVDERDPDVLGRAHVSGSVPDPRRFRQVSCAAVTRSSTPNSLRSRCSGSASARTTPSCTPAAEPAPTHAATLRSTFP